MSQPLTTTECLLDQCRRYPALEPEDLIKALHQSVYGCGHLVGAFRRKWTVPGRMRTG